MRDTSQRADQKLFGIGTFKAPGMNRTGKNEGVGNTSGSYLMWPEPPMKLRTNDPHRIKNANHGMTGFFAGPVRGKSKPCPGVTVQPFDLMSRRHPLSSTRAAINIRFEKQIVVEALVTSPALPPASIVAEEVTSSWRPSWSSSRSSSQRSSLPS
jgi:hypothetical protein